MSLTMLLALFAALEPPAQGAQRSALGTRDSITVTATRTTTRLADTPASVVVLDQSALSTTPSLITRQRRNQGSSRSRGVELDSDWRPRPDWRLSAGWLFAGASLSTGRRTPQVPRNTATLQAAWRGAVGVQARWSSRQFDDDLNQFPLRGYAAVDLFASRGNVYVAIENVTNERIEAGATPVLTLGQPRAVRFGVRWAGK